MYPEKPNLEYTNDIVMYILSKTRFSSVSIGWKQCADLSTEISTVKSTIIEGKVYCGGVTEEGGDTEYIDSLPLCLVTQVCRHFLSNGSVLDTSITTLIVAIGGWKRNGDKTNEVYMYDEQSRKWKQTIPPMPASRVYPSVLSLKLHIILVIGGYSLSYTAAVEIFKSDISQWFKADPLPKACCDMSSVAIDDIIYSLGGYKHPLHLSQALCAPISDLLHSAVSADDSVESEISFTKSVWKKLPNTPTYEPAAAVLGGKLLAIGGTDKATKG